MLDVLFESYLTTIDQTQKISKKNHYELKKAFCAGISYMLAILTLDNKDYFYDQLIDLMVELDSFYKNTLNVK